MCHILPLSPPTLAGGRRKTTSAPRRQQSALGGALSFLLPGGRGPDESAEGAFAQAAFPPLHPHGMPRPMGAGAEKGQSFSVYPPANCRWRALPLAGPKFHSSRPPQGATAAACPGWRRGRSFPSRARAGRGCIPAAGCLPPSLDPCTRVGMTATANNTAPAQKISIHTSAQGTTGRFAAGQLQRGFHPTPPRGGRHTRHRPPLARGQDFNPRTRAGCDRAVARSDIRGTHFNPRTCAGANRKREHTARWGPISAHAPTRGATQNRGRCSGCRSHFNPRPYAGGGGIWARGG